MDRELGNAEVMHFLDERGEKFLMAVSKTPRIKKVVLEFRCGKRDAISRYEMRSNYGIAAYSKVRVGSYGTRFVVDWAADKGREGKQRQRRQKRQTGLFRDVRILQRQAGSYRTENQP